MKAFVFENYKDNFNKVNELLKCEQVGFEIIKFKNGEGKIVIDESVKNEDVIIFSDFSNRVSYTYLNKKREYSKDEYYVELKRLISCLDSPKSISVFLPSIYQSRQNTNNPLESKDYLMFINELKHLNVDNILTFEVHGEEKEVQSFSLSSLFKDREYDVVVSPDEGGYLRSIEYSKVIGCECVKFSKKRDLSKLVDGSNPITSYENCNYNFNGKKVLIVDDILDSGNTIIQAISHVKGASKVDVFVAYPFFLNGVKEFKKLVKDNRLNKVYLSNLISINKNITRYKFIEIIDCSSLIVEKIKEVIE